MEGHSYLRTHNLAAEHLVLDLGQVVTELHGASARGQSRGSVTLVKQSGMTIVLTHLHAGSRLEEHAAKGAASVQVLDGRVRMTIKDETLELNRGRLIAFDAGVRHTVEALEDSTLILTLVAPVDSN
jgi:quercetin dioxygenase-like cupin family protein